MMDESPDGMTDRMSPAPGPLPGPGPLYPSIVHVDPVDPPVRPSYSFDYADVSSRLSAFVNGRIEAGRSDFVAAAPFLTHGIAGRIVDKVEGYVPVVMDEAMGWLVAEFEQIKKLSVGEAMIAITSIFETVKARSAYQSRRSASEIKDEHA
jgi:hypothetical protein